MVEKILSYVVPYLNVTKQGLILIEMKKFLVVTLLLLLHFTFWGINNVLAEKEKITFGIILTHLAVSPSSIQEGCKPFAKYLSDRLGIDASVEIIPDIDELIRRLDAGSINMGYLSNLDYLELKKKKDVTPYAKVVKGGNSLYNAIILVRKDSGINTLADLKGKKFAYTNKTSSHGYLYPSIEIKKAFNTPLESFFGEILNTKKDPDGILAVLYKRSDAVSASSQTFATLCELMPRLRRELKVISTSEPMVHGPMFFYKPNIKNPATIDRIKAEMLNMDKVVTGKQVLILFKIGGWTSASDSDYNTLRTLVKQQH